MKIIFTFLTFIFLSIQGHAQHVGCVTIYEQTICESDTNYSLTSSTVNWSVTKEEFQEKIRKIVLDYLHLDGATTMDVHFWVNDFNSIQSIKIQGWNRDRKFMISFPLNFHSWGARESTIVRRMDDLPYPLDYGFQLGELLISCKEKCQSTHFDFLNEFTGVTVEKLTDDLLVLKIPDWSELDFLQKIQTHEKFNNYFRKIELSPVVEANGYSQLAFRFTISL